MSAALYAIETVIPYTTGGDTGEVAVKLENRYQLCEKFFNFIAKDLEEKFMFFLERDLKRGVKVALDNAVFYTSEWLTNQWREYIENAMHGFTTKASQERGDPAFIDTGNFYKNLRFHLRVK